MLIIGADLSSGNLESAYINAAGSLSKLHFNFWKGTPSVWGDAIRFLGS